ncbi:MAG: nucleotide exchange factor GrpE [Planctomycetia bacterium]|nr:nucleotide exchange factor GrpE [Planctomycetia bacterium]
MVTQKSDSQAPNEEAQPAQNGGAASDVQSAAQAEADRLRAELAATKDQLLRAHADFDNYRKRASREREEERQFYALVVLGDLLPVWDNIARAIEAAEKNGDAESLRAGFKLVAQQLTTVQEKHGCKEIKALGQPFDPQLHEALLKQPSSEYPANTVSQVVRAGFKLHDRVLRPAQVIVSTGPA